MNEIKILTDDLINQIAAGEVVERPSSVVKELVDNALDAKSSEITIIIEDAGMQKIKVIDNGQGMNFNNLKLSIIRHATSKLNKQNLFAIETLGFRGEALPSIAQVSKFRIESMPSTNDGGIIEISGGKIIKSTPKKGNQGTIVEVNNLFFNTPARLKYLTNFYQEKAIIVDYVNKIALINPHIKFKLIVDNKEILNTIGDNSITNVYAQLYNVEMAEKIIKNQTNNEDFQIQFYLLPPNFVKRNKNHILLKINNRLVKNPEIIQAVIDGYHSFLGISEYPHALIDLKASSSLIDVNVHPNKNIVRISKIKELKKLITKTINETLAENLNFVDLMPNNNNLSTLNENSLKDEGYNYLLENDFTNLTIQMNQFNKLPEIEVIGQLWGTYIIGQSKKKLYLIDQHALQERIKYEEIKKAINYDNPTYQLLVPYTYQTNNSEMAKIIKQKDKIKQKLGIEIEEFGINSIKIDVIPTWIPDGQESAYLNLIMENIINDIDIDKVEVMEQIIAKLACVKSIKANHALTKNDMWQLLNDLDECDFPDRCPHGRPIIIEMNLNDIEKMFKRKK